MKRNKNKSPEQKAKEIILEIVRERSTEEIISGEASYNQLS